MLATVDSNRPGGSSIDGLQNVVLCVLEKLHQSVNGVVLGSLDFGIAFTFVEGEGPCPEGRTGLDIFIECCGTLFCGAPSRPCRKKVLTLVET